ncbi:MAG: hypothetical protein HC871_05665 [Rhizobiales bacterium]|nr:hypothetical protein [Hyphomicrobiales bacterium]
MIGVATLQYALIPDDVAQFMVIVAGVSMVLTPLLALAAGQIGRHLQSRRDADEAEIEVGELGGHVIIAGFGRVGRAVAQLLASRNIAYVAVDSDLAQVRGGRKDDMSVVYGNATDRDLLEKVGAERAALVLVALGDAKATTRMLEAIRRQWPDIKLLARARDAEHAKALSAMGVEDVVPETLEASLQLGGLVLRTLGVPAPAVNDTIDRARAGGYRDDNGFGEPSPGVIDGRPDREPLTMVSSGPTLPGSV